MKKIAFLFVVFAIAAGAYLAFSFQAHASHPITAAMVAKIGGGSSMQVTQENGRAEPTVSAAQTEAATATPAPTYEPTVSPSPTSTPSPTPTSFNDEQQNQQALGQVDSAVEGKFN